jgi:pimeloyl-ACP methyl ester carboxylesterase
VHELHTLLTNTGIAGPYVLVGHSFGGLYTRVYANQYPDEVAGMVLVDASHPDMWVCASRGQDIYNAGVQMGGILAALAPFGIARLQSNTTRLPSNYDMPPERYEEYQALRSSTRYWNAALAELRATPTTMNQVRATRSRRGGAAAGCAARPARLGWRPVDRSGSGGYGKSGSCSA